MNNDKGNGNLTAKDGKKTRKNGRAGGMFLVLLVIVLLLLVMPGCKSGDIWSALFEANEYISIVGQNMHARGWPDFPDNVITWTAFVDDLKGSISDAKSKGVTSTGAIRDIENRIMATPDPDLKSLAEAFDSHGEW